MQATIDDARSGDFGTCMAEAHRAQANLDKAQQVHDNVKKGVFWTASGYYAETGHKHAKKGLEHIKNAEIACLRLLEPLEQRVARNEVAIIGLEERVAYLESLHEIMNGVTFQFNSSRLTQSARTTLDLVANSLKRRPVQVEIAGFTDNVGSDSFNMGLSKRRAEAVRTYLVKRGVDAGLLSTNGYGMADPVESNETANGRHANRRAVVVPQ